MSDADIVAGADRPGQEGDRVVGSDRVLVVLKELAGHPGGVGLDELTRAVGSPKPTVHRALRSLRRAGLAGQDARGHYLLGDEFLRLAFAHHEARPEHVRLRPVLETLAERFGETTHYAVLDGREVVYRAKVDPPTGAARLTSTVGGRNPAHSTGVGKLLLAYGLGFVDGPLERRTPSTIVSAAALRRELALIRERGYALDDEENEPGVACLALPVYALAPGTPSGAISISALTYRTPLATLVDAVDEVRAVLGRLGESS
ncbi:IclR family transcriptional regulator [Jiangella anatolica]|uniref:IclR family transcriptional regulator n=1 Tax=Jiangella anatolica TaxID=2670374 RepID=UPI0018F2BF46|nr:IclR family transcriptional regulator [Jiangella anatolica]